MSRNQHRFGAFSEQARARTNLGFALLAAAAGLDALLGNQGPYRGIINMTDVGVDEDTVTLGGYTFHLRNGTATPAGQVDVDITGGQTADEVCTALAAAINAQTGLVAIADLTDDTVAYQSTYEIEQGKAVPAASEALTNGTIEQQECTESAYSEVVSAVATSLEATNDVLTFYMDNTVTTVNHIMVLHTPASAGAAAFLVPASVASSGRWLTVNFTDTELGDGDRVTVFVHYD